MSINCKDAFIKKKYTQLGLNLNLHAPLFYLMTNNKIDKKDKTKKHDFKIENTANNMQQ